MVKTETPYNKVWHLEYDIDTNKIQTASKNTYNKYTLAK